MARAKQLLGAADDPKRLNTNEVYAQSTVRLADYPSTVKIKLQALHIGQLGIVAIPCEVFAQMGKAGGVHAGESVGCASHHRLRQAAGW